MTDVPKENISADPKATKPEDKIPVGEKVA